MGAFMRKSVCKSVCKIPIYGTYYFYVTNMKNTGEISEIH